MSQDDARLGSEASPLQAPSGEDFRFPARVNRESGAAIPLPPPSGQTSPAATGQRDDRPAGSLLPPGPSRLTVHVSSTRSQASPGPSGAGSRTAPALGAAAPSWPRSGTLSTRSPRFPTLRLRAPGSPRYRSHSDGAMVRRTRASGLATPGPDLDSVLRQRRRENRKKGKGGKKKDKKCDSVILISFFFASKRSFNCPFFLFRRLFRPFYR